MDPTAAKSWGDSQWCWEKWRNVTQLLPKRLCVPLTFLTQLLGELNSVHNWANNRACKNSPVFDCFLIGSSNKPTTSPYSMCILFNSTKYIDASANETYLTQSKSPASSAYTSNVIPINSIGHMNETSRIRLFDQHAIWSTDDIKTIFQSKYSTDFPYYF